MTRICSTILACLLAACLTGPAPALSQQAAPDVAPDVAPQAAPETESPQAQKEQVLDTLHQRLGAFAQQWLTKLRRNQIAGPATAEVMSAPDGTFVARYFQVTEDADPVCTVRESCMKPGAYIGSIIYKVAVFECAASSAGEAKRGPYQHTSFTTLNEIFSIGSKDLPWSVR